MDGPPDEPTALVIAADRGEGFDGPKYLATHRGRPLLQRALDEIGAWPVSQVVVVLGDRADDVLAAIDFGRAMVVIDPEWKEGMAASIRVGLDCLVRERFTEPCVLARGDHVGVLPEVVPRLLVAQARSKATATVPKYRYVRGWPIVVSERLWGRLMGLEGEVDVLDVLSSHPEGVTEEWFDSLPPHPITGPDDLPATGRR